MIKPLLSLCLLCIDESISVQTKDIYLRCLTRSAQEPDISDKNGKHPAPEQENKAMSDTCVHMSRARHLFRNTLIITVIEKIATHCRYWHRNVLSLGLVCVSGSNPTNRTTGLEKKQEIAVNKMEGHKSKGFLDVLWAERDYFEKHLLPKRALTAVLTITFVSQEPYSILVISVHFVSILFHFAQVGMMKYLKSMHPFYFQVNYSWNYCPLVPHTWNKTSYHM